MWFGWAMWSKSLKHHLKWHIFPRNSVLGPKVPQNGLKLKHKSNKCYGAKAKIYMYQISCDLVEPCGQNPLK